MVAGESRQPSQTRGFSMLLPLVRRIIQTGHGPTALIHWLGRAIAAHPNCDCGENLARQLAEELATRLTGPTDPQAETYREL
jgi:hypothetical protein